MPRDGYERDLQDSIKKSFRVSSGGTLNIDSFQRLRTDVVKWWNEMLDESLHWKYVRKKYGNKIVKVKLMEIRKAEDA